MTPVLPNSTDVESLLAKIDALIGLSAAFPQSRSRVEAPVQDEWRYEELWNEANQDFANLKQAGFPIVNPNLHRSLKSIWAWCLTFEGAWDDLRKKPREVYTESINQLHELKEILSHADAPLEVQRELRESARRANELFIIMAFRPETQALEEQVLEPAAHAVGLDPVVINDEEPEDAISEAILSAIRRATLVLCDLSFERPNCYFEAGFAKGAFRRVLYTCRKDHDVRNEPPSKYKVHFDVDQFKITWWDPQNFDSAKIELGKRLRRLLEELAN